MAQHEITNVLKTGKQSPQFGDEYMVKFADHADAIKVWRKPKNAPTEGATWEGDIVDGKFVKPPYEGNKTEDKPAAKPFTRKSDNSDGMRQGMCINNAANFVNGYLLKQDEAVSPDDWAEMVHAHANALYALGDLTSDKTPFNEQVTDPTANVKNIFGISDES